MSNLKTVAEKASELGHEVKELGRSAGQKLQEMREGGASAFHEAAASVRKGSDAIEDLASSTAGRLDAAGAFVKKCSANNILVRVRKFGRNHLGGALIAAVAIGFFAGSALNRAARSRM